MVTVAFHDETLARVLTNPPDDLQKKGVEDLTMLKTSKKHWQSL